MTDAIEYHMGEDEIEDTIDHGGLSIPIKIELTCGEKTHDPKKKGRIHVNAKVTPDALRYVKERSKHGLQRRQFSDWRDRTFVTRLEDGKLIIDVPFDNVKEEMRDTDASQEMKVVRDDRCLFKQKSTGIDSPCSKADHGMTCYLCEAFNEVIENIGD